MLIIGLTIWVIRSVHTVVVGGPNDLVDLVLLQISSSISIMAKSAESCIIFEDD